MRLVIPPGVFAPPSDACMLAAHLRREPPTRRTVLDLCAGSGVLAMVAALEGAAHVTAVDVSRRAVVAVRLNALLNGVRVEALRGDLFVPLSGRRFDLIVTNPPYLPGPLPVPSARGAARAWEGGPSGRELIERIAAGARRHLSEHGALLLVCSTVCGERATLAALRAGGLVPEVRERRRGPLGPRLRARASWLRQRGLLLSGDQEELLVIRAQPA